MRICIILFIFSLLKLTNSVNPGERQILEHAKIHATLNDNLDHLNIHLFPHSHFDVGWLKKVDEYMFGQRSYNDALWGNATQTLNSAISELVKDEKYKFVWAEMAFFSRWYMLQNENVKDTVKYLIKNKQFSIVGGGWVVNDEACTYYEDIIDQLGVGHQFLDSFLNFNPSLGWQQDPFGHSLSQAWILNKLGMEGQIMSRIDYQEELTILDQKKMQFMWALPYGESLFTQILFYRYVAPEDYQYDYRFNYRQGPPSQQKSMGFANFLRNVSYHYETDEFLYSIGNDFTFADSKFSFQQYDTYIQNIEKEYLTLKTNVQYQIPDEYLRILNKKQNSFQKYKENDDFFPYRDQKTDYWTGYFTSKPFLKKMTIDGGRFLQKVRNFFNLEFMGSDPNFYTKFPFSKDSQKESTADQSYIPAFVNIQKDILLFEQEIAVMQHHDAVTGTCQANVADDYVRRVIEAKKKVSNILSETLTEKAKQLFKLNLQDNQSFQMIHCAQNLFENKECSLSELLKKKEEEDKDKENKAPSDTYNYLVDIFNYMQFNVNKLVEISGSEFLLEYSIFKFTDQGLSKEAIEGELLCMEGQDCKLIFYADLISLSSNYFILQHNPQNPSIQLVKSEKKIEEKDILQNILQVKNKNKSQSIMTLQVQDQKQNQIKLAFTDTNKKQHIFSISYKQYNKNGSNLPYQYDNQGSRSGAYLFKVYNQDYLPDQIETNEEKTFYKGKLISCVQLTFKDSVSAFICIKADSDFVNLRSDVKQNSFWNKSELVLDINVEKIKNKNEFQTDSNGLFRMNRTKYKNKEKNYFTEDDPQDKVSGNFYPITKFISIKDGQSRLTVFNDRSQGGSSLEEGNIQIMIQRQTSSDDNRGVGEPLSDQNRYLIDHQLLFDFQENAERQLQYLQDFREEIFISFLDKEKIFSQKLDKNQIKNQLFEQLKQNLPSNVRMNVKYLKENIFLVRLQNILDQGENIDVNLQKCFQLIQNGESILKIISETNLQGTRTVEEIKLNNIEFFISGEPKNKENNDNKPQDLEKITLKPLQIRAFTFSNLRNTFQTESENLGQEIWQREENSRQEQCDQSCLNEGLCVWKQCECLRSYGEKCENACQDDCLHCMSASMCTRCEEGYKLIGSKENPNENKCVSDLSLQCEKNQFFDQNSNKCQNCNDECEKCENTSSNCTHCSIGYGIINQKKCERCPKNTFSEHNQCKMCSLIDNCELCDIEKKCLACKENYLLMNNKQCSQPIQGCKIYKSMDICEECQNGYKQDFNKCIQLQDEKDKKKEDNDNKHFNDGEDKKEEIQNQLITKEINKKSHATSPFLWILILFLLGALLLIVYYHFKRQRQYSKFEQEQEQSFEQTNQIGSYNIEEL